MLAYQSRSSAVGGAIKFVIAAASVERAAAPAICVAPGIAIAIIAKFIGPAADLFRAWAKSHDTAAGRGGEFFSSGQTSQREH